jgi:hypothetical protein
VVFVSSIRYRQPAMLTLIIFAAAALLGMKSLQADSGCHVLKGRAE